MAASDFVFQFPEPLHPIGAIISHNPDVPFDIVHIIGRSREKLRVVELKSNVERCNGAWASIYMETDEKHSLEVAVNERCRAHFNGPNGLLRLSNKKS
jgi:hypothetical protein